MKKKIKYFLQLKWLLLCMGTLLALSVFQSCKKEHQEEAMGTENQLIVRGPFQLINASADEPGFS